MSGFKYCGVCSQKLKSSKVTVSSLAKEFLMSFFNLDSRFFQTMGNIIFPGTLTRKYIDGKRKSYINPARLFLFSLVFFFAVLSYFFNSSDFEMGINNDLETYANQTKQKAIYDSLLLDIKIDSTAAKKIRSRLFPNLNVSFQDSIEITQTGSMVSIGGFSNKKFYIGDIASMEEDEFVDHYRIDGRIQRLLTKQVLRVNRNPKAVSSFMIGNMLWAVVLGILFLALVMKLLYIRNKKYFVEHLILQMHVHSFSFILLGVLILIRLSTNTDNEILSGIGFISILVYLFIAFKRYYGQGFFKTLFKVLFTLFSYLFIMVFCAMLIVLISILVF